jgi:hypothetical protein
MSPETVEYYFLFTPFFHPLHLEGLALFIFLCGLLWGEGRWKANICHYVPLEEGFCPAVRMDRDPKSSAVPTSLFSSLEKEIQQN